MTRNTFASLFALSAMAMSGCATDGADAGAAPVGAAEEIVDTSDADDGAAEAQSGAEANIVDVVLEGHVISLPETIASGWTTFRLDNRAPETHFGFVYRVPEGKDVADVKAEVAPVFQAAMNLIDAGDPEAGFAEFANLPAWSQENVYLGGPGLTSPGETSATTLNLAPGTYVMECYVKTGSTFHTTHGMITGFTVTDDVSELDAPDVDVEVSLSYDAEAMEGQLDVDGELRVGPQTIAVSWADQSLHGNGLGHDLHIARLGDDTDTDDLALWMSWVTGLTVPSPVTWVGGTHEMPGGNTAYIEVDLEPGRYVLISEVDDAISKGLHHEFVVS